MKAAVLKGIENLEMEDISRPTPSPQEILIKVKACSICGTDIRVYHHGHKHMRFPRITGHELSGEIVEIGKRVEGHKLGEKVAIAPAIPCGRCHYCRRGMQSMCINLTAIGYHYDGGFAEFMVVPEDAVRNGCVNTIPSELSFEEAALAEPLACAINGQQLSQIDLGNTVVVVGAGPLGCIHLQLAKAKGASRTILVELSRERIDFAKKFAFPDIVINPSSENAIQRIKEETEGRGADRIIVSCPSGKAQEESLSMVAPRGIINFFGGLPLDNPFIKLNSNLIHYGEFYVVGTHGSAPYHNELALSLISQEKVRIKELVTHRLPLERLEEGLALAESKKGMKVLINP
ncbi:MAG: alcohol dehydrogenase catalytic domain-containing protein [Clostridia bacterium]|jgi:L-iditol 2-dehydrogenase|nr:alcohol dehydrogenase catalytic domain-containing protein [Clostridia bacterium]